MWKLVGLRVLQETARSRGEEGSHLWSSWWGAVGKYLKKKDDTGLILWTVVTRERDSKLPGPAIGKREDQ